MKRHHPHHPDRVRERYNGGCVASLGLETGCGVDGVELTIGTVRDGDTCVVTVAGEVDIYTSPALKAALAEVDLDGCRMLVVDLCSVGFIDSSGLGVLVGALRRAREAGGDLRVVSDNETVARILRITGLDSVFSLHATLDEALGA
jgi:anti-sigma B factor antagonist